MATYLEFHSDGSLSGAGTDGEDGPYVIERGAWSGDKDSGRVAWIEKYDDGLAVVV